MKGAPKGNQNAHKGKVWKDAIHRYVVQHPQVLGKLAESLIAKAQEGDVSALKELGDRLDGKSVQAIEGNMEHTLIVEITKFSDGKD